MRARVEKRSVLGWNKSNRVSDQKKGGTEDQVNRLIQGNGSTERRATCEVKDLRTLKLGGQEA